MRLSQIASEDEIIWVAARCEFDDCACRGAVHDAREES